MVNLIFTYLRLKNLTLKNNIIKKHIISSSSNNQPDPMNCTLLKSSQGVKNPTQTLDFNLTET